MQALHRLIRRVADKAIPVVAIAALTLAALGLYFFINDESDLNREPRLRRELAQLDAELAAVQQRIDQLEVDLVPAKSRVVQADKVIAQREQIKNTWSWFTGNREQQKANEEQLERMQAFRADAAAKLSDVQQELRRVRWERDGRQIERDRVTDALREEEARQATFSYYLQRAWLRSRSWIFLGAAAYLFVPVLLPAAFKRWREGRAAAV
ncbi:MAG TPA: hypothetical protein VNR00_13720 [Opitutus sp.]|nr:hypothetical protein [Opitutus sp.]